MKYVVLGAGGTGGILSAALFHAGYDVTLIARGEHLKKINEHGLIIRDLQDGTEKSYAISACTENDYQDTADVIFVCVKGYSIESAIPFLDRISGPESVIIPVLNIFTTGETLRNALPGKYAVDGCIYVSANISEPGKLLQHSKILRVIYGAVPGQEEREILEKVRDDFLAGEIKVVLSSDIRRDALKKFCYVSPIGAAGLYLHATAGDFQKEGPARDLYIGMMREVEALAEKMGSPFDTDVIEYNLKVVAHQPPETTTSLQRDVYAGKQSEIKGLVFDIPEHGEAYGIDLPLYRKVSRALSEEYHL